MKTWQCIVCGFICNEAIGLPGDGIAAGSKWKDVLEDWERTDSGAPEADFEMVEI